MKKQTRISRKLQLFSISGFQSFVGKALCTVFTLLFAAVPLRAQTNLGSIIVEGHAVIEGTLTAQTNVNIYGRTVIGDVVFIQSVETNNTSGSLIVEGDISTGGSFVGDGSKLINLSIPSNSITSAHLAPGIVGSQTITDGSITGGDIAPNAGIDVSQIEDLSTTLSNLQAQIDQASSVTNAASVTVEVTNDEIQNGLNLIAAYNQATNMNPSAINRIVVIVPPGRYNVQDIGLHMHTEYIDLIGLTSDRESQYLYGTPDFNNGVIKQSADHVRIENLTVINFGLNWAWLDTDPAGYYPVVPGRNTVLRNCRFGVGGQGYWSMRAFMEYAGYYENCVAGKLSFGGYGTASGTFVDCVAGYESFGSLANGTFIGCQAGGSSFGAYGTASGTFTDCEAEDYSFAGYGTASGTFTDCEAEDYSFACYGTASGTFTDCEAEDYSFAYCGTASGTFRDCVGGNCSFGSIDEDWFIESFPASAVLVNCTAGPDSFGQFNMAATNFSYNAQGHMFAGGPIVGDGSGLTNLNLDTTIQDILDLQQQVAPFVADSFLSEPTTDFIVVNCPDSGVTNQVLPYVNQHDGKASYGGVEWYNGFGWVLMDPLTVVSGDTTYPWEATWPDGISVQQGVVSNYHAPTFRENLDVYSKSDVDAAISNAVAGIDLSDIGHFGDIPMFGETP